ncbi:MAG TPA: uroporphyrinogen-III C-methyltransferase [Candidatus Saccharimonadales bacterium]|nr:uroporphyrinogen-III C-methyltransferase [Candidatus Saccharimonadales bacterium]HVC35304.1 uroporphyrinogen-III C-methyltransferase [Chloroflexota bacterium]
MSSQPGGPTDTNRTPTNLLPSGPSDTTGTVWLVGAGPGDPELITVRGWELLRSADAVVYDRLIPSALLDAGPRAAERYDVGKFPGRQAVSQDEINALLIRLARAGKRVVRLKGGDPFVFGRGGEEALALSEAGVAWEEVPGVSAAIAAAAYAGIPVTHRGVAESFAVLTGHDGLARPGVADADTLVILMGIAHLREVVGRLLDLGRDPDEPAALVQMASMPTQRTIRAPLRAIGDLAGQHQVTAPATLVVGQSVRLSDRLNWFERRPLFGRRVLVARTRLQTSQLAAELRASGADVVELPTLRPRPVDPGLLDLALRDLASGRFSWAVFGSPEVVQIVWERLDVLRLDSRAVRALVGGYGPGTVEALRQRGIHADWDCPSYYVAAVASGLQERHVAGLDVFVPSIDQSDALDRELQAIGARVRAVPVAQSDTETSRSADAAELRALLESRSLDAFVFPASRSIERIAELLGADLPRVNAVAVVCMGPSTAGTARRLGLRVDSVAESPTRRSLVEKVAQMLAARPDPQLSPLGVSPTGR